MSLDVLYRLGWVKLREVEGENAAVVELVLAKTASVTRKHHPRNLQGDASE